MTEEIQQLLKNLRLRKMAEMVEGELTAARKDSPSYSDVLARLLRAEWLDQQERRLQSRIKGARSEEHTSELQSQFHLVCRLLLEKKKKKITMTINFTMIIA